MSFRDWLHKVALRGCLIAAFLLSPGISYAQSNAPAPAQQPSQQQPATAPATVPEPVLQTEPYKTDCEKPKDHDAADLCEQRRMATAAEDAVWWARTQTWLGGLGFAAVIITLILNGIATSAAARAANSAEKAIVVENRPWIKFVPEPAGSLKFEEFGANLRCVVRLTNVGGGPAKILGLINGEVDFYGDDPLKEFQDWVTKCTQHFEKGGVSEKETVFPDEAYDADLFVRISKEMMAKAPKGEGSEFFSSIVTIGLFYKSAIADEVFYTARAYLIGRQTDRGNLSALPLNEGVIPDNKLSLSQYTGLSRAK